MVHRLTFILEYLAECSGTSSLMYLGYRQRQEGKAMTTAAMVERTTKD